MPGPHHPQVKNSSLTSNICILGLVHWSEACQWCNAVNSRIYCSPPCSLEPPRAEDRFLTPETGASCEEWYLQSPMACLKSLWHQGSFGKSLKPWPGCLYSFPTSPWSVGSQEGSCWPWTCTVKWAGWSGKLSWHCIAAFPLHCNSTAALLACGSDLLPCHISKAKAGWAWSMFRWKSLQGKHKS